MARRGTRGSSVKPAPARSAPAPPPPAAPSIPAADAPAEPASIAPAAALPAPKRPPRKRASRAKPQAVSRPQESSELPPAAKAAPDVAAAPQIAAANTTADLAVIDGVEIGAIGAHLAESARVQDQIHHGPEARATPDAARATADAARAAPVEARATLAKPPHAQVALRRRHGRRRILIVIATASAGVALFSLLLALHAPRWYQPAAPPPERRQAIRDDVQDIANRFSERLLQPQPFLIEFTDVQLNEWFATREHVWPRLRDILPPDVEEPCVRFRPDRIELAARLPRIAGRPVVTARIELAVEDDEMVMRVTGARVGALPAPLDWLRGGLATTQLDHRDERSGWRVSGSLARGVRAPARLTWWNGRRDFVVRRVELGAGVIRLLIEPIGSTRRTS